MQRPGTRRIRAVPAALLAVVALALGGTALGCFVYHGAPPPEPPVARSPSPAHGHGPPPHAPAHGYRRKHQQDGVELVYDSGVHVYVVVGREAVYWDGVRYLRWVDGAWQASVRIDGVWVAIGSQQVPSALAARHGGPRG